jgi:hypothetical protein
MLGRIRKATPFGSDLSVALSKGSTVDFVCVGFPLMDDKKNESSRLPVLLLPQF